MLVLGIIAAVALALFALAWWSSGRSRHLRRGRNPGDAQQDQARWVAEVQRTSRDHDSSGFGGGF